MNAEQELAAFGRLLTTVMDDVRIAFENVKNDPSQFHRRTLIRTIFTAVEGLTHLIKQESLARIPIKPDLYTPAELAMLREETYALDSKGDVYAQAKFLRTDENFRFAMKMYLRGCNIPVELNVSDRGWSFFKQSLQVRHRITHPKQAEDLEITDSELDIARATYNWFMATVILKLVDAVRAVWAETAILRMETDKIEAAIKAQRRGRGRPRKE